MRNSGGKRLIQYITVLLYAAAIGAAVCLLDIARQPQTWIRIPAAWMGTPAVQNVMHLLLRSISVVWILLWAMLGIECDALILRSFKGEDSRMKRLSFVLLWLLAFFGVPAVLLNNLQGWRLTKLFTDSPSLVAPLCTLLAVAAHLPVVLATRNLSVNPGRASTAKRLVQRLESIHTAVDSWMQRPAIACAVLAVMLLIAAAMGIVRAGAGKPAGRERANIVLITVDTLRADHLSGYGYRFPTAPNLADFAHGASTFTMCRSTSPITLPSTTSILTSQYPSFHSVGPLDYGLDAVALGDMTIAKVLKENGYRTAAFVSNFVLRRGVRLYEGFDVYDDTFTATEVSRLVPERSAGDTNRSVLNWLDTVSDQRFFLWVHYQDPHGPYTPPKPYLEDFPQSSYPAESAALSVVGNFSKGGIPKYQYFQGENSASFYRARYDAEIAYVDNAIGQLLTRLKELGLWEKSIVVLSADHGEAMGEHDYYFIHGQDLTSELIHVPLIVRVPGTGENMVSAELVSTVDIVPTILDAVGLPAEMESDGMSLLPLMRQEAQTLERDFVVSEDPHLRISLQTRTVQYIAGPDGERLYATTANGETEPAGSVAEDTHLLAPLRKARDAYRNKAQSYRMRTVLHHNPEVAEKLRSLGYLE